jgi:hypothetical protein
MSDRYTAKPRTRPAARLGDRRPGEPKKTKYQIPPHAHVVRYVPEGVLRDLREERDRLMVERDGAQLWLKNCRRAKKKTAEERDRLAARVAELEELGRRAKDSEARAERYRHIAEVKRDELQARVAGMEERLSGLRLHCLDNYLGGHAGPDLEIFRHGMETVVGMVEDALDKKTTTTEPHCPCDIHRHHESCHRCRGGERCPYRCECRCHCPAYKLRGEGGS